MFPRLFIAAALFCCVEGIGNAEVVISQIYGAGGNSGAAYRNDFIELFNRSSNTVALTGWSVQYASASGTSWQVTPLSGTIAPGRYLLVQQSSGGSNGTNLPVAEVVGTISMSATAGKVALVNNSTALSGTCPLPHGAVVDLVGYGTTASCAEGTSTPAHGSTTAVRRAFDGCVDTDNNSTDFFIGAVVPRNSGSPSHSCDAPARAYAIHEIQGTNSVSPLAGQSVTLTTNIVTARRNNGFFVQSVAAEEDADSRTSQGIFVLTSTTPGTNVLMGHAVVVTGVVTEFRPAADASSPSLTQINASHVRFVSAGNGLPTAVTLTANDLRPNGGHEQLERFEGMRVAVDSMLVTAATAGFVNEINATGSSSGVFYGVIEGTRPLREPGIHVFDSLPANTPCCVPRFDGNPEVLRVDSNGQPGVPSFEAGSHMVVGNLVGPLYYEARHYTLLPDTPPQPLVIWPLALPPSRHAQQVTVAAMNLQHFYDTTDDDGVGDVALTSEAYSNRLQKAGLLLRDVMDRPNIVGVAEVENLAVLRAIAEASAAPYAAWLFPGNDPGGINLGFLVNTARVSVIEVTQVGKSATFAHPNTGMPATLHDRPPLLLRANIKDESATDGLPLTIIMVHLRSLIDIENAGSGAFVRAKRRAQAEYVAQLAEQRQSMGEHVVVMGDFNAFEFNDGYVDVVGTIGGSPAPSSNVVLASADMVNPNLINLTETLPAAERYSYVFEGTPQALDHILVSRNLFERVSRFVFVRNNADVPESSRSNAQSSQRISDHDPAMVYLTVGTLTRIVALRQTGGEVNLEGEGVAGVSYEIERSTDLLQWEQIGSAAADQAGRFSFRDLSPVSGAAFYRLRSD